MGGKQRADVSIISFKIDRSIGRDLHLRRATLQILENWQENTNVAISFKRKVPKGYCIQIMFVVLFKSISMFHFPRQINLSILEI